MTEGGDVLEIADRLTAARHAFLARQYATSTARPPPVLYHYTSTAAFKGIVDSGELWFTDVRYLNDASEFEYAMEVVASVVSGAWEDTSLSRSERDILKLVLEIIGDNVLAGFRLCVVSLSRMNDSLQQWVSYAGGTGGVSIGLDCRNLRKFAGDAIDLVQIEYKRSNQEQAIATVVRELLQTFRDVCAATDDEGVIHALEWECSRQIYGAAVSQALRFKGGHWQSEAEWRLVASMVADDPTIEFRTGPLGLTPYLPIPLRASKGNTNKLPICEIMIGPGPHQELALAATKDFLVTKGYGPSSVAVRASNVPLRF